MAGPRGLAAGPCEPWLWLAALQGSVCFVGRAALCLRLLYHKTLSTGTKTRGKYGSCLKNIRNSERGSARFSGNPCSRNSPSSGESSRSGKTLWFRAGSWKAPEKSSGFGKNSCSGKTFRNREDRAVLFRLQTPLGKRGRFYRQYGRGRGIQGESRTESFEILRKVNFVLLDGRIFGNPHERWIFEEVFGEFPDLISAKQVSNQCFT